MVNYWSDGTPLGPTCHTYFSSLLHAEVSEQMVQALKEAGTPQEEIKAFMASAKSFAPFLMKKYKDLTFHMGANCNPDGAIIFEFWPDEAQLQPSFMYIDGGLKQTKA